MFFNFLFKSFAYSSSIQIFNIDPSEYPVVKGNILILNNDGSVNFSPSKNNIRLVENGENLEVLSLDCEFIPEGKPVSTILSIDLSQSMRGLPFSLAKDGAKSLIDIMNSESETAISGFSDYSILFSDFTGNKDILRSALDSLVLSGGTNFEDAFLNQQSGALALARRAKNKPIIIFLTDGVASGRYDEVIKQANEIGAIVHSVVLFKPVPNFLKEVSENTGGMIFDKITTLKEIYSIYQTIYRFSEIDNPCKIKWISKNCNIAKRVDYFYGNASGTSLYNVSEDKLSKFEYTTSQFISFQNTPLFDNERKVIEFKAIGDTAIIQRISSNNPFFQIILPQNITLPHIVPQDSIFSCFVQFNYDERGFHFAEFEIESNICRENKFFASGGRPEGASDSYIEIIEPNGGEVYLRGADTLIRWQANYERDKLMLEFSSDNGRNWNEIIKNYSGYELKHKYPLIVSNDCLIRITKLSDSAGYEYKITNTDSINNSSVTWQGNGLNIIAGGLDGYLRFVDGFSHEQTRKLYAHPSVTDVEYAPDALRFASAGSDGKIKIWLDNSTEPRDSVQAFDGEVTCIEWSPDGLRLLAGDNNGNLKIFNGNNLSLISQVKVSQRRINDIRYSPDGRRIGIALSDTSVAVLFSNNYNIFTKYNLHRGNITSLDWIDNDLIVSVSSQPFSNDVIISSANLSSQFYGFRVNETLSKVRVNHKKEVFAFTGINGRTYIYGTKDFAPKYNISSQSSWRNEDLAWSPDFTRVVASSFGRNSGQTLKFTSIEVFPEFRTQSNKTFSIFQPIIDAKNINFGNVLVNRTRANTIDSFVTVQSLIPIRVDSVRIIDDQFNVFSVDEKKLQLVGNDDNYDIYITFTPKEIRTYSARIEIFTEYNKLIRNVTGTGFSNGISDLRLDFGKVKINRNAREQIFIRNTSPEDIMIDSIVMLGINRASYKIISGDNPTMLRANSQNQMGVIFEFTPNSTLLTNDIANIYFNREGAPARILLSGQGIKPELAFSSIDTISTFCGEDILINIKIENKGSDTLIVNNFSSNGLNFNITNLSLIPLKDTVISAIINIKEMGEHLITYSFNSNDIDNPFVSKEVILINFYNKYSISKNNLFFESKKINEVFSDYITIENTGNVNINWDFDLPLKINDSNFELIEVNPLVISQNQSSTFTFRYTNSENIDENTSFNLPIFCDQEQTINLSSKIIRGIEDLVFPQSLDFTFRCDSIILLEIPIENIGSITYDIKNVSSTNNIIHNINYPISLPSNSTETIKITLLIQDYGTINDVIIIYIDEFEIEIPINITREKVEFKIDQSEIVTGIKSGVTPQTYFTITNTGDTELNWSNFQFNEDGLILLSVNPLVTSVNNSSTFFFVYNNLTPNEFEIQLTDECDINQSIPLIFYLEDIPQFNLIISNYDKNIGDNISLEIELSDFKDFDFDEKKGIVFNLSYNPTLLENKSSVIKNDDNLYYEQKVLLFEDLINSKWLLPNYQVLWGNDSTSQLTISDVMFIQDDEDKVVTITEGLLRVLDLCQVSGTRLYLSDNFPYIKSIYPNPSESNSIVTIFLPIDSEIDFQIIDMLGNSYYTSKQILGSGDNTLDLSLNLATGIYFIKINVLNETHSITLTEKIHIIK